MTNKRHADITCPHWKRYKNRKKTLRRNVRKGWITEDERKARQLIAYERYIEKADLPDCAWHRGTKWLAENPIADLPRPEAHRAGHCNEECIGARGPDCECDCEGANHGAANAMEPHQIKVKGITKLERAKKGLLDPSHLNEADLDRYLQQTTHGQRKTNGSRRERLNPKKRKEMNARHNAYEYLRYHGHSYPSETGEQQTDEQAARALAKYAAINRALANGDMKKANAIIAAK